MPTWKCSLDASGPHSPLWPIFLGCTVTLLMQGSSVPTIVDFAVPSQTAGGM